MSRTVLVLGGTGKTGSVLARRLREEGWPTRVATRAPQSPDAVRFDWYDPSSFEPALAGVERVFLLPPLGSLAPLEVMQPFIERAIGLGARRFVLLSSSLIEEGGPATGAVHAFLRDRAPEWAVLRPSWFMQNFCVEPRLSAIRDEGLIYSATEDGVVPFIAVEDIAEVALRALIDESVPAADLLITGPAALSYDWVAEIIGNARGKRVRHVRLTVMDLARRFESSGIPANFALMLASLDGAIAAGAEARTTATVARVTGRDPVTFEAFAASNAHLWAR